VGHVYGFTIGLQLWLYEKALIVMTTNSCEQNSTEDLSSETFQKCPFNNNNNNNDRLTAFDPGQPG